MKSDIKTEYDFNSCKKLIDDESIAILIPENIVKNTKYDQLRIALYVYLFVRRGMDDIVYMSISDFFSFINKSIDRHKGAIFDKFCMLLEMFRNDGIVDYDNIDIQKSNKQFFKIRFNSLNFNESDVSFCILYWDEVKKILNYKNKETKNPYFNNLNDLIVFSYLRFVIPNRPNTLPVEYQDIKTMIRKYPEAYNCYYKNIADALNVNARNVSASVLNLENLDLIHHQVLYRTKFTNNEKDAWKTEHTIFVNCYKRSKGYLLATGDGYYQKEIDNKIALLNNLFKAQSKKTKKKSNSNKNGE